MGYSSLFADAFGRSDSATVGNGWAEDTASTFEILSNALKATGGGAFADNIIRAPATADFQDGKAVFDMNYTSTATPQIMARLSTSGTDTCLMAYYGSGTTFRIAKLVTGTLTTLVEETCTMTAGVNYRMTLELEGNSKTAILYNIDTATTISTITESSDSTITASGYCGTSIDSAGTITYDNFESFELVDGIITTSPIKNYSGTLQTNKTGWIANVYNDTTGALVVKKTSQTTNASGVMTITDPLIVTSTSYRVDIDDASTLFGNKEYTAT